MKHFMDLFGSRYIQQLTFKTTDSVKHICSERAHHLPHSELTWAPKCQDAHKVNILTLINKASAFENQKNLLCQVNTRRRNLAILILLSIMKLL